VNVLIYNHILLETSDFSFEFQQWLPQHASQNDKAPMHGKTKFVAFCRQSTTRKPTCTLLYICRWIRRRWTATFHGAVEAVERRADRDVAGPAAASYHWRYPRHVVRRHDNRLIIITSIFTSASCLVPCNQTSLLIAAYTHRVTVDDFIFPLKPSFKLSFKPNFGPKPN